MTPQLLTSHINALYSEWKSELPPDFEEATKEYLQAVTISVPQNVSHVLDPEDKLVEEYLLLTQ